MISEIQALLDALNGLQEIGYKVEVDRDSPWNQPELDVFDSGDWLVGTLEFTDTGWKYKEWER